MSGADSSGAAGSEADAGPGWDAVGLGGALDTLAGFRPKTGNMEAWNAAYVRVEDYLRAHRIHNRLHQSRLIQTVLERAARRHEANPALNPTQLAVEELELWMQRWFTSVLGATENSADRVAAQGRLAMLLCDGPQKWPYVFLDNRTQPTDFVTAMRTGAIDAGPDMSLSSMVPRPIDLGPIPEAAGETIERIEDWPIVRTLLLWLVFAGCLAVIFRMTR
ncbi:hypothetical protein [Opitutus sp. ER46]|uniref:hypothetical protein n=1 Tax=Opitutus sp. ER46 TaxID=2161864 RepID=UPI000D31FA93|nr:hypothetical protein [Opitutus sp. ER46]PTX94239.1 hypothetical protein DB354_10765 [Opitutus sp. ER46]